MLVWFIFYTYPKSEKSIFRELTNLGYDVYLPMQEQIRQWHDRRKKLQVPLFPNYIFVKIECCKIYQILSHPRVVRLVSFSGKHATINDDEIERIKKITANCKELKVLNALKMGSKVRILDGPLKDMVGILTKDFNNDKSICINIPSIKYSLCVNLTCGSVIQA